MSPAIQRLKTAALLAAAAITTCVAGAPTADAQELPRVYLLDGARLAEVRRILHDDATAPERAALDAALAELQRRADEAITAGPFSVVNKPTAPPSGDMHDYMSQAPYWWPDPATPNGLPYIRRDGERNPDIHRLRNRPDLAAMVDAVELLAVAHYLTADERYGRRAALLLRAWFLDQATRMNPHLRYAQAIPGINDGRGIGLIETRALVRVVDAIGLLDAGRGASGTARSGSALPSASPEAAVAWTADDQRAIVAWFDAYLEWLRTSDHGRDEADELNNHGTFYDVQIASFALFVGKPEVARQVLRAAPERRIAVQIEPDGRQPLELARTKAWSYSVGNLAGFMSLARLGEQFAEDDDGGKEGVVDLWQFETADGRSLRRALDFLAPYGLGEQAWPYQQINGFSPELCYGLLRVAAREYPEGPYRGMTAKLPAPSAFAVLAGQTPTEPLNELFKK